jgi:DNA-binding transcriptional regulator YiaG
MAGVSDDLPALIKAYREARGLSQAGLAERWQVPVMTIRGWERGKRPAQPGMMITLLREATCP